ncbi:LacI family DNA-binding transcriptional regulator, partial [Microbacterium sp. zg.Y909]
MSDVPDRPPLRVTISDVAAAAGVSRATATRALKGEGRFAEETRARILEICERLGYVPNTMAAELAAGRTGTVGLLLRDASNPAYGLLFSCLQDEANRCGLDLVTVTIGADTGGTKQVTALQRLLGMRVAGLIVATGGVTSSQLDPFADQVPIIRAGRDAVGDRVHSVAYDEHAHGTLLADHVHSLGHRRVAVLATDPAASFPEHVRASAMRERLEAIGVEVETVHVTAAPDDGVDAVVALASSRRITAVLCPSDYRQLAVLRAARAADLDVPRDLSVTGCDGILPGADLLGLTTVRIPVEQVARETVEAMQHLLASGDDGVVRRSHAGPLVPGSTAAAP